MAQAAKAGHGGQRTGAGRKKKTDKHAGKVAAAEKRIADRLPQTITNLEHIADGGEETVEEEWVAAGTVTVGKGPHERQVFPNKDPLELVCIKRKVVTHSPDLRANVYLADRIMGKPTERVEHSGPEGGSIPVSVEQQIDAVYGDDDEPQNDPNPGQGVADETEE